MADLDSTLVIGIISIIAASLTILSFAALVGGILSKINLMLIKYHITRAAQEGNIENLSNEFIKLSISKLRSQDLERKKIGLLELQYGWLKAKDANKRLMIDELIDVLNTESDSEIRKEIIVILYKLITSDPKF